ncbi:MAG: tRNA (adenosine(37)-N6)-threonylcarbamoyltransferase complex ATPase subunit type 1 TsaE [Clostridiales bacterium]|nr:tRNA (adenosine(37)-N6)-threonylcarbamoyltransferase complex ATPase subunit type 1 TsaE [Clostridiales bacterium]
MLVTHSAMETRQLGMKLAALLRPGDTVLLKGGLGAGKSELARGIARGLGIAGPVPSPSFTILNAYDEGRLPLYHFDWYRIEDPAEISEMGLEEMIGGDGVALIEWSEKAPDCLPKNVLLAEIKATGEEEREITLTPLGGFPFGEEAIS